MRYATLSYLGYVFLFLMTDVAMGLNVFPTAYLKSRKPRVLFVQNNSVYRDSWMDINRDANYSIRELLRILSRSRVGAKTIRLAKKKAAQQGMTLLDIIFPGKSSICDTTLVRKFSVANPLDVVFESHSKVFINKELSTVHAVLDLAHELTHFIYRRPFNPYNENFTVRDFIASTIEGKGGEVAAYLAECKVLYELFPSEADNRSNCSSIMDGRTGRLSKRKGVKAFYRIGDNFGSFIAKLNKYGLEVKDFPLLSSRPSSYVSSAYNLPYPVAAFIEYNSIKSKVCRNDKKRLQIMREQSTSGRYLASYNNDEAEKIYNTMKKSYWLRCRNYYSRN
ncbi:MAG: hypothetical protein ISR65_00695 [Bacteriovoracaceae bacterium]|nr:hypothetical protein [Bacteriovoracaceae bacterium]